MKELKSLVIGLVKKATEYPANTWKGFKRLIIYGLILTGIGDYFLIPFLQDRLAITTKTSRIIFIVSFSALLFLVLVYFIIHRFLTTIRISFSKKLNIVLAYDITTARNVEKVQKSYKKLETSLNSNIRLNSLEKSIKVIVAPQDTKFSSSNAEAKTNLGLVGSTLVVWGDVVTEKRIDKFRTRFSYEFGHASHIDPDKAKNSVNEYISKLVDKGLFHPVKNTSSNLEQSLTFTTLFILGFCTLSLGDFKKSEGLFEKFLELYKKSDSLLLKYDLSVAKNEAIKHLIWMYANGIYRSYSSSNQKNKNAVKDYALKIIALDEKNYDANLALAFLSETEGDQVSAISYNNIASASAGDRNFSHLFNNAYFAIGRKDYPEAVKIYDDLSLQKEDLGTNLFDVANNLNDKYKSTNDLGFLFAEGYVTFTWGEKRMGERILREFLKKALDPIFDPLLSKAKEMLKK